MKLAYCEEVTIVWAQFMLKVNVSIFLNINIIQVSMSNTEIAITYLQQTLLNAIVNIKSTVKYNSRYQVKC